MLINASLSKVVITYISAEATGALENVILFKSPDPSAPRVYAFPLPGSCLTFSTNTCKAFTIGADGSGDLKRITFTAAPASSSAIYVLTTFDNEAFVNTDLNGNELLLDADGDTSITADTDDQIDIKINGADDFQFTANTFTILSGSTITNSGTASGFVVAGSYTHSKATGDGSTTAFTITSGRAINDVLVFVNGVCLVPTDDYTISGTTLTFATAPASSAEITFRFLPLV